MATALRLDDRRGVAVAHEVTDTTSLFEIKLSKRRHGRH
jgi:hypothetical protein